MAKFNVVFSDDISNEIERMAQEQGVTKAHVLRQAISLMKWFERAQSDKSKIIVESTDGKQREVLPIR